MSNPPAAINNDSKTTRGFFSQLINILSIPTLAIITSFVLGGLVIWLTSGSLLTVLQAYDGLVRGAFFKQRALSETLVATTPYILLSLGVAVGFKTGLFNIGVEGQFYVGAICAAIVGVLFPGLPEIIHLPLTLLSGILGGAFWAAIPGYLKARTGAHEVISTIMLNYVAFRLSEYIVSYPMRDQAAGIPETVPVAKDAQVWTMYEIPKRLQDPLNALMVAIIIGLMAAILIRWLIKRGTFGQRVQGNTQRRLVYLLGGLAVGAVAFLALPPLTRAWWPFNDPYDRLHIGLLIAIAAAVFVWWFLFKTTIGFELLTVGANPTAARYAGVNITRNIVLSMAISGALAGLAGTIEVVGVTTCRCLQVTFSSGYGFDSIAIALLAKNSPFGILAAAFLFGAMRNGADLMELNSGVSKYVISLIQGLLLLFVAAPTIVRWIFRIRASRKAGPDQPTIARTWGGG